MKTKLQVLAAISVVLGAALQLYGQGYIVPNGVLYIGNIGTPGFPVYEIDVLHNPNSSSGNYTGFLLQPRGMTPPTVYINTFLFDPIVDIGVRVFLVSSNDAMSLQPIQAHSYMELVPTTYVFNSGQPFYLGLYTGNVQSAPPDGIYNDPLFGWAELVNNRGVIELLDGALAYKADGIYVGTRNIIGGVPEPSILGLSALGALLLGGRDLRRR